MRILNIYLLLISLLINFNLSGNNSIDSLKRELKIKPQVFKSEINIRIAESFFSKNVDSSLKYANSGLYYSLKLNDLVNKAEAYRMIGKCYAEKRNFKLALLYFNNSVNLFQIQKNQSRSAEMYNSIGILYGKIYNYDKSLFYIHKSIELLHKEGDYKKISTSLNNLSVIYRSLKDFNKSFSISQQSLYFAKKSGDEYAIASSLNNISLAYIYTNKNKEALDCQLKAIVVFEKLKNKKRLCSSYLSVGSIYSKLKMQKKAKEFYLKSLVLALELKDFYLISFAYQNIGSDYLVDKDFQNAFYNLKRAEEYGELINDLGCLKISSEKLAEYYSKIGDYKNAFEYYKKFKSLNDSIYNKDNQERFQDLQLKYEVEEKDKENKILRQETTIQKLAIQKQIYLKNTFIAVSSVILLLVFFVLYRFILKRNANRELSEKNALITLQKDKLEEANAAKDKLFSLIGHDLKTPFYVILRYTQLLKNQFNELSEIEKKENIDELFDYTREIYTILENMLTWSRSQKGIIHIKKEKIILNSFIDSTIKPYLTDAKNKSITINNEIDEATIIFADRYTIGTTINNLFYNAVKFTPVGGRISFESKKLEHDGIQISITDSGVGIKEDDIKKLFQIGGSFSTEGTEKEKGTGLGLIICKEFVEYNNGSISVTSKPDEGSIFSITLPLN